MDFNHSFIYGDHQMMSIADYARACSTGRYRVEEFYHFIMPQAKKAKYVFIKKSCLDLRIAQDVEGKAGNGLGEPWAERSDESLSASIHEAERKIACLTITYSLCSEQRRCRLQILYSYTLQRVAPSRDLLGLRMLGQMRHCRVYLYSR